MKAQDIITAILRGDLDGESEAISNALRERQKIARVITAQTFKATVQKGAKVRFVKIRPAYLKGQLAVISSTVRGGNRVEIKLYNSIGRFRAGMPMGVPVECLEVVPDDTPVPTQVESVGKPYEFNDDRLADEDGVGA